MKNYSSMNIALFTSNHRRHKFIAHKLHEELNLKLIICESKSEKIEDSSKYSLEEKKIIDNHFLEREKSEEFYFGSYITFPENLILQDVSFKEINSKYVQELLKTNDIQLILLFGTSIISNDILSKFENKVINLHLGLSPYYKGSGTNFFPIKNNHFEYIGATFHLATTEVDSGKVLHQIRSSNLSIEDSIHSIGNKTILEAGESFPLVVKSFLQNELVLYNQDSNLNLFEYRIKDFNVDAIKIANENMNNGNFQSYLINKAERDNSVPIFKNLN